MGCSKTLLPRSPVSFNTTDKRELFKSNSGSKEGYPTGGNSSCPGRGMFSTRVSIRGHRYPCSQSTDTTSFCRCGFFDPSERSSRGYHIGVLVVRQYSSSSNRFFPALCLG